MPASLQHLDVFLSASPVVFYTVRPQPPFRHTYISGNLPRLLGHSTEAFLVDPDYWFSHIHPEDAPAVYSVLPQLYVSERLECEYRFRTSGGEYRWLRDELCLVRDEAGRAIDIVGCWIDITSKRAIADENRRLAQIVQQTTNLVLITDADFRITWVNPAFEKLSGYTLAEVAGRRPVDFLFGPETDPETADLCQVALAERRAERVEIVNYTRSGERYWVDVDAQPIMGPDGGLHSFVLVQTDITAKKALEQDLIAAREAAVSASRAKSSFLASMSHEIRTPLNAILGFSQLLKRSALTAAQQEQLGVITSSGEHLLSVLNGILELSKIEAGRTTLNPEVCDLQGLVRNVVRLLDLRAREKFLELRIEGLESLPFAVRADGPKLRQLLLNLLGNAIKFTAKGQVLLRLRASTAGEWLVRIDGEVEDTGPGIAPEEMPLLFRHFSQTRLGKANGSGTGLGLAISREFARLMGGDISAESTLGKGSLFRFHVVVGECADAPKPAPAAARRVYHLEAGQPPCRILIVNDQREDVLLLEQMLTPLGFEVRVTNSMETAYAIAEGWRPSVAVFEHRLHRLGRDGALRKLKDALGASGRVLCLSSSGLSEDRAEALSAGADAFLSRPFMEDELLESLRKLAGVRYTYVDASGEPPPPAPAPELSGDNLRVISSEMREALRAATLRADLDRLSAVIEAIGSTHPNLAAHLHLLADRFDYEKILQLLKQASRP